MDSSKLRLKLKIFQKKRISEISNKQNLNLPVSGSYLHSVYIVLDITSNLEVTQNIWEDVYRLYANTMPFYIRDLSICGTNPMNTEGLLYSY